MKASNINGFTTNYSPLSSTTNPLDSKIQTEPGIGTTITKGAETSETSLHALFSSITDTGGSPI